MISTALMVFVATAIVTFYILLQNIWYRCNMAMVTSLKGCSTLNRIVYGRGINTPGVRSGASSYAWDWTDGTSYILYYTTNRSIAYDAATKRITDETENHSLQGSDGFQRIAEQWGRQPEHYAGADQGTAFDHQFHGNLRRIPQLVEKHARGACHE